MRTTIWLAEISSDRRSAFIYPHGRPHFQTAALERIRACSVDSDAFFRLQNVCLSETFWLSLLPHVALPRPLPHHHFYRCDK